MLLETELFKQAIDNVNLNMRFQWRFAPGSDFFVVYTQNSYPGDFETKNQGQGVLPPGISILRTEMLFLTYY